MGNVVLVNFCCSVADPDPVSGAFLTSGSGILSGSRIPNPYFRELGDNFLDKKFYNFKNKIIFNFVKFVATIKGMTKNFFHPSLLMLLLDPGFEIRDG
jgi:hypothetical protein